MKVRYDQLRPSELRARMAQRPVAYLPMGTLEWHGEHLPFGVDAILSEDLMRRCAERCGGVVLPPLHVGPDRSMRTASGELLIGMDYDEVTTPPRRLEGSCYWIEEPLFLSLLEALLAQVARAGFRAVFADGHGPSRWCWAANLERLSSQTGLELFGVTPEVEAAGWQSQMDHAGRNETSQMLAVAGHLVDLAALSADRADWPQGVAGDDPRDATEAEGEVVLEGCAARVDEMLRAAGV